DARRAGHSKTDGLLRIQEFDAEALRLRQGTSSEILAAETSRKAQIILNSGTHTGLSTGCFPFDQHGLEPFRSTVDGSGQAGRPSADDDEIIERLFGLHAKADF